MNSHQDDRGWDPTWPLPTTSKQPRSTKVVSDHMKPTDTSSKNTRSYYMKRWGPKANSPIAKRRKFEHNIGNGSNTIAPVRAPPTTIIPTRKLDDANKNTADIIAAESEANIQSTPVESERATSQSRPASPPIDIKREPSPASLSLEVVPTTTGTKFISLPKECRKTNRMWKENRNKWVVTESEAIFDLGLRIIKRIIRDDGLAIDWESSVPVDPYTLHPPPPRIPSPAPIPRSPSPEHSAVINQPPISDPLEYASQHQIAQSSLHAAQKDNIVEASNESGGKSSRHPNIMVPEGYPRIKLPKSLLLDYCSRLLIPLPTPTELDMSVEVQRDGWVNAQVDRTARNILTGAGKIVHYEIEHGELTMYMVQTRYLSKIYPEKQSPRTDEEMRADRFGCCLEQAGNGSSRSKVKNRSQQIPGVDERAQNVAQDNLVKSPVQPLSALCPPLANGRDINANSRCDGDNSHVAPPAPRGQESSLALQKIVDTNLETEKPADLSPLALRHKDLYPPLSREVENNRLLVPVNSNQNVSVVKPTRPREASQQGLLFLKRFMHLFDTDRLSLIDFYSPNATLSFTEDFTGFVMSGHPPRTITKVGPKAIIDVFQSMDSDVQHSPLFSHTSIPLDDMDPGGLLITCQGTLFATKSVDAPDIFFTRIFVVMKNCGPQQETWPWHVVSDNLTLRRQRRSEA